MWFYRVMLFTLSQSYAMFIHACQFKKTSHFSVFNFYLCFRILVPYTSDFLI